MHTGGGQSRYGENLGECGKIVASDDEHLDKLEQVQVEQSPGVIAKLYEDAWGLQQGHDLFSFVVKDYQYKKLCGEGADVDSEDSSQQLR
jgi:hypothetical protein